MSGKFLRGFFLFFTVVANWFVSAACSPHPRIWHLTPHKSMLRNHRNFTTSANLFCKKKTGPKLNKKCKVKWQETRFFFFLCTSWDMSHICPTLVTSPGVVSLSRTRKEPCVFPGARRSLMASFLETFLKNHLQHEHTIEVFWLFFFSTLRANHFPFPQG